MEAMGIDVFKTAKNLGWASSGTPKRHNYNGLVLIG
jgi:hypothetical protein